MALDPAGGWAPGAAGMPGMNAEATARIVTTMTMVPVPIADTAQRLMRFAARRHALADDHTLRGNFAPCPYRSP